MGVYATTTSLAVMMIGTTFDSLTTALASKLITHAENEINKHLSKRYDISSFQTVTSVPPLVTSLAEQLAVGYMYRHMDRGGEHPDTRPAQIIKPIMENLKAIADYKMDLLNTAGAVINDMSNTSYRCLSTTDGYSNTFNEDDPLNWQVDSDKLDDISDERDE